MTPLTSAALALVVDHLPTPVVLVDAAGLVARASPSATLLLGLPASHADVYLERHLREAVVGLSAVVGERIETDTGPHELVAIIGEPVPLPPKDVAALAGAVAHDFNNLLGVIMNFTALAAATVPPGSAAANDLREVQAASQRAATIAQRLQELGDARGGGRFAEPR